jgi:hypothetical protein
VWALRADAVFAKPAIYDALEKRGVQYATRMPPNDSLAWEIADLLFRPRDTQAIDRWSGTRVFSTGRAVGPACWRSISAPNNSSQSSALCTLPGVRHRRRASAERTHTRQ